MQLLEVTLRLHLQYYCQHYSITANTTVLLPTLQYYCQNHSITANTTVLLPTLPYYCQH